MAASDVQTTAPRARGRGRPRGGALVADREQLIEAAMRAIRRHGPGATVAQMAAEASVTTPILYRNVGDKQAVAEAVAEELSRRVEAAALVVLEAEGVRERFRQSVRTFFQMLADDREVFFFVEFGWGSADGRQVLAMIERSAAPYIEAQGGASPLTRTRAYATVGALRTVALMWISDPYCDLDELVDDVTEYVYRTSI